MAEEIPFELGHRAETGLVVIPHDPRQVHASLRRAGDGVHLLLLHQLQAVLQGAEEPVGFGQGRGVAVLHVAGRGQLDQRGQSGGKAQSGVVPAVHELEELHGELDVADAARPPLDLPTGHPPPGDLSLGARLHGPQLSQLLQPEGPAPHSLTCHGHELTAELGIARRRPRLDERLELPCLRPAVPVRLI